MPQMDNIGKHKTTIQSSGDVTVVTYHATPIVTINHREGTVTLDSGGWRTKTTKTRMNQAASEFNLPYHIYQKRYKWYVDYYNYTLFFIDGMKLPLENPLGIPIGTPCQVDAVKNR